MGKLKCGAVVWHSSGEDEGPDIGVEIGLGDGRSLYMGELAAATLSVHGEEDASSPSGWWLIIFGASDAETQLIGPVSDGMAGRDAMDVLAAALSREAGHGG